MSSSWLSLLLQVIAGGIASYLVGMVWFSGLCFGRPWWSHTFPNHKDGNFLTTQYCKLHLQRAGSYVIQSVVIVFIINSLLSSSESMTSCHLLSFVPLSAQLPLFCSLLISILMACTTYPHYIYSGKSTVLFLICVGYDAVQVTTGTLAIYSLALAFN